MYTLPTFVHVYKLNLGAFPIVEVNMVFIGFDINLFNSL